MSTEVQIELDRIISNIVAAFTSVQTKGGTVPDSQISDNLASAIESIPAGVTIQRKTGSFTTNSSGKATVSCGFKPDFVAFVGGTMPTGAKTNPGFPFTESGATSITLQHGASSSSYLFTATQCDQTSTGFIITMTNFTASLATSAAKSRTCKYWAVKYT